MNKYIKKLYRLYCALNIRIHEKENAGVRYIYKNKNSNMLIIVFSGIGGDYNYRRSFQNSTYDQLYIKDNWADGVSYYLYENGKNVPEMLVSRFIDFFLINHKYSKVITFGSSKGGSAALYFGLKHHVDEVYAGACQFYVGNYLGVYHEKKHSGYYKKVMADINIAKGVHLLNETFRNILKQNTNTKTIVHLIYSIEEHTYPDHIKPLIKELDECHIKHIDQRETFPVHSMIGDVMKKICLTHFVK